MILIFLLSLLISIVLHELSHLIAAKKVGCAVQVFSVGFGKPFYSFEYKGTRYNFTPILLGGYCQVKGETGTCPDPDAFCNLSYAKKLIMILAGCFTNLVTGLIAYFLGIHFHVPQLYLFGYLSIALGIGNLLPIPALDGFYPFGVLLEKKYGKEKGYDLLAKINKVGFVILMALNIACLPFLIAMIIKGTL